MGLATSCPYSKTRLTRRHARDREGIFGGLFGHGGRGAAAAAEAAAQERSRVRRRVSESPDFFERTCGPRDGPMDT